MLKRGLRESPESDSLRAFRALTLHDLGRHDEAIAEMLTIVTDHADVTDLGRYSTGLAGLASWFLAGRPDSEQRRRLLWLARPGLIESGP